VKKLAILLMFSAFIWGCGACKATDLRVLDHPSKAAPAKRLCWTCDDNDERVCVEYEVPGPTWKKCLEATE